MVCIPRVCVRVRRSFNRFLPGTLSGRAIVTATLLLVLTPFWLAGTHAPFHGSLSNKALAAADASGRAQILEGMSKTERAQYAREIRNKILNDPSSVAGLGDIDIALALQPPELQRKDGPVQVWQYRSGVCVLDVFLQGGNVVHYEMRNPGKAVLRGVSKNEDRGGGESQEPDHSTCLKTIIGI